METLQVQGKRDRTINGGHPLGASVETLDIWRLYSSLWRHECFPHLLPSSYCARGMWPALGTAAASELPPWGTPQRALSLGCSWITSVITQAETACQKEWWIPWFRLPGDRQKELVDFFFPFFLKRKKKSGGLHLLWKGNPPSLWNSVGFEIWIFKDVERGKKKKRVVIQS